jgi:hypothetical protein
VRHFTGRRIWFGKSALVILVVAQRMEKADAEKEFEKD